MFKYLLYLFLVEFIHSTIVLDINVDVSRNISIKYSGVEVDVVTDKEVNLFKIDDSNLVEAVRKHFGKSPTNVYLTSPTPWGDIFKEYRWEKVSRVLSIKTARLKSIKKKPIIITTQDFENKSNVTIKVNTGISHSVKNSLATIWSKDKEISVTQEIQYEMNMIFEKLTGKTGFSYSSNWGQSEEKTETVIVGSTSAVETELKPGQAVTAILTANAGYFEIEVVYKAYLKGNLAVNFKNKHKGHHFWGPQIQNVMKSGGINNEITTIEIIKFDYHVDASLTVYDKVTNEVL